MSLIFKKRDRLVENPFFLWATEAIEKIANESYTEKAAIAFAKQTVYTKPKPIKEVFDILPALKGGDFSATRTSLGCISLIYFLKYHASVSAFVFQHRFE